jgi:hypothetical protein
MMRYTFESFGQLASHLHVVGNQALLFVRDQTKPAQPLSRVVLELEVSELKQKTTVRGEVVARADGRLRGSWLQLSDLRLARQIQRGSFNVKRQPRVSGDQLLQLATDSGVQLMVQLLDISPGGMRVRSARGIAAGQLCTVRLVGARATQADLGKAQVLRADGSEAGLKFLDERHAGLARYLRTLEEAWARALQIRHPPECCRMRGPIEPPMPKLRKMDVL